MKLTRAEILLSIILFAVTATFAPKALQYYRDQQPISDWFEVTRISPGDAFVGDPVHLVYAREIRQPFSGVFDVRVLRIDHGPAPFPMCSNSEAREYTPKSGSVTVTLEQFLAEPSCVLPAGVYIIEAIWVIKRDGYSDKRVAFTSSPFTILKKP